MAAPSGYRIPCCWPRLPAEPSVRPYLEEIDAHRWYSNFGPLWERLQGRLAGHFSLERDQVALVANGTLGLTLSLMARTGGKGGLCLMPSWTFVATAHAARLAGLEPCFADVDPDSWALTPSIAATAVKAIDGPIAAVMPVCPFGCPQDLDAWADFERDSGLPVVVDAAAAFDGIRPGPVPALVSLHATKALGIGEGGLLMCSDADFIREVTRRSNFGFFDSRDVEVPSLNAKLSEYHAAVGLAALDQWPQTRESFRSACERYLSGLDGAPGVSFLPGFGQQWVSSSCAVTLEPGRHAGVMRKLEQSGIESRRWWRDGCHREEAFAQCPRTELPVSEALAESALGLPLYPGIGSDDVETVCRALIEGLEAGQP